MSFTTVTASLKQIFIQPPSLEAFLSLSPADTIAFNTLSSLQFFVCSYTYGAVMARVYPRTTALLDESNHRGLFGGDVTEESAFQRRNLAFVAVGGSGASSGGLTSSSSAGSGADMNARSGTQTTRKRQQAKGRAARHFLKAFSQFMASQAVKIGTFTAMSRYVEHCVLNFASTKSAAAAVREGGGAFYQHYQGPPAFLNLPAHCVRGIYWFGLWTFNGGKQTASTILSEEGLRRRGFMSAAMSGSSKSSATSILGSISRVEVYRAVLEAWLCKHPISHYVAASSRSVHATLSTLFSSSSTPFAGMLISSSGGPTQIAEGRAALTLLATERFGLNIFDVSNAFVVSAASDLVFDYVVHAAVPLVRNMVARLRRHRRGGSASASASSSSSPPKHITSTFFWGNQFVRSVTRIISASLINGLLYRVVGGGPTVQFLQGGSGGGGSLQGWTACLYRAYPTFIVATIAHILLTPLVSSIVRAPINAFVNVYYYQKLAEGTIRPQVAKQLTAEQRDLIVHKRVVESYARLFLDIVGRDWRTLTLQEIQNLKFFVCESLIDSVPNNAIIQLGLHYVAQSCIILSSQYSDPRMHLMRMAVKRGLLKQMSLEAFQEYHYGIFMQKRKAKRQPAAAVTQQMLAEEAPQCVICLQSLISRRGGIGAGVGAHGSGMGMPHHHNISDGLGNRPVSSPTSSSPFGGGSSSSSAAGASPPSIGGVGGSVAHSLTSLESLADGIAVAVHCDHSFHIACLRDCINSNGGKCPLCGFDFAPAPSFSEKSGNGNGETSAAAAASALSPYSAVFKASLSAAALAQQLPFEQPQLFRAADGVHDGDEGEEEVHYFYKLGVKANATAEALYRRCGQYVGRELVLSHSGNFSSSSASTSTSTSTSTTRSAPRMPLSLINTASALNDYRRVNAFLRNANFHSDALKGFVINSRVVELDTAVRDRCRVYGQMERPYIAFFPIPSLEVVEGDEESLMIPVQTVATRLGWWATRKVMTALDADTLF